MKEKNPIKDPVWFFVLFTLLFLKRSKKECIYINVFMWVIFSLSVKTWLVAVNTWSTHWSSKKHRVARGWHMFEGEQISNHWRSNFPGVSVSWATTLDASRQPSPPFWTWGCEQLSSPHWLFGLREQVSFGGRESSVSHLISKGFVLTLSKQSN